MNTRPIPDSTALRSSAQWHLYDLDASRDTAWLLQLKEADYYAASFLDQRVEPLASAKCEIPIAELEAALLPHLDCHPGTAPARHPGTAQARHPGTAQARHPGTAPARHPGTAPARHPGLDPGSTPSYGPCFIFHLGHCGSTLLSRALSASPNVLPVREPLTLRKLAAEPGHVRLLPLVVAAHSRVFHPGQTAVIKATSTCNALIEPLLAGNEAARAILMMVHLEAYLAGMLGKLTPPRDLRAQAGLRLADWSGIKGAPAIDLNAMDEAQLAVLSWLTSMRLLDHAARNHPNQALLLDFEKFLAEPESSLQICAAFLGFESELPAMQKEWPAIATGYSKKPDEPYSAFNRHKTLQRGRVTRGAEIRQGLEWAQKLIADVDALSGCGDYLEGWST